MGRRVMQYKGLKVADLGLLRRGIDHSITRGRHRMVLACTLE